MSLFIVSTPIGNLADISMRAKQVLANSEVILAEDTKKTSQLLSHFNLSMPKLIPFYEGNESSQIPKVINWLQQGKKVSLVSNAGTPLISDPGYNLVRQVIKRGFKIISIPGPTALISALVVSGFPPTRFVFLGFLPKSGKKKADIFQTLTENSSLLPTVIFYESPYRLTSTLEVALQTLGNISVVVCREITKKFEEKIRGRLKSVLGKLKQREKIKGEITVVLKIS